MSEKLKVKLDITYRGSSYPNTQEVTSDGLVSKGPGVSVAPKAGTLGTRTDDDTGVVNVSTGHNLITGDKVDAYWAGGSRRQMACTVSTNAITVDGGDGDILPPVSTAVTLVENVSEPIAITGDDMEALIMYCDVRACVTFLDDADAILYSVELDAGQTYSWLESSGLTNPIAGDVVASMRLSHLDASERVIEVLAFVN